MDSAPTLGAEALRSLVIESATQENSTVDLSGILWMEHLNLIVGDLDQATAFYIDLLGFSRYPSTSFHINLGQQQFHLATPKQDDELVHTISGSIGMTVPNLQSVIDRIPRAKEALKGTKFEILQCSPEDGYLSLHGPWGNKFHIYDLLYDDSLAQRISTTKSEPSPRKMDNLHDWGGSYGSHRMAVRQQPGIRYIEFACRKGTSRAIGNFYQQVVDCRGIHSFETLRRNNLDTKSDGIAVSVGPGVHLLFVEHEETRDTWMEAMKGIHICIYVQDFHGLYQRLSQEKLIWSNPRFQHLDSCDTWEQAKRGRTLRFRYVLDLETKEPIYELEHETRPLLHGQYMKPLQYTPR